MDKNVSGKAKCPHSMHRTQGRADPSCCPGEEASGHCLWAQTHPSVLVFLKKTELVDSFEIPEWGISFHLLYTSTDSD